MSSGSASVCFFYCEILRNVAKFFSYFSSSHPLGYSVSHPLFSHLPYTYSPHYSRVPAPCPSPQYIFFSPLYLLGVDFHWYRLDNNGQWSHKPGETSVTDTDNIGNVITDPRVAPMGFYQFVTFMTADRNTVTIGGTRSCILKLLSHVCPSLGI